MDPLSSFSRILKQDPEFNLFHSINIAKKFMVLQFTTVEVKHLNLSM